MKLRNALLVTLLAGASSCGRSPIPIPDIAPCAYSCSSGKSYCAKISKPDTIIERHIKETPIALSKEDYKAIDNFIKAVKQYFRENQALLNQLAKENPELLEKINHNRLGCTGIECSERED